MPSAIEIAVLLMIALVLWLAFRKRD